VAVDRVGEAGAYTLTFPVKSVEPCGIPVGAARAVGAIPAAAYRSRSNLLFLLGEKAHLERMRPDFRIISGFPADGLIVTARADTDRSDFGCRYFAPQSGLAEDPVTAAIHATLAPFWAERLEKRELTSRQLSPRGGLLHCSVEGTQVHVTGTARLYLKGQVYLNS